MVDADRIQQKFFDVPIYWLKFLIFAAYPATLKWRPFQASLAYELAAFLVLAFQNWAHRDIFTSHAKVYYPAGLVKLLLKILDRVIAQNAQRNI